MSVLINHVASKEAKSLTMIASSQLRRAFLSRLLGTAAAVSANTLLVAPACADVSAHAAQHRTANAVVQWNSVAGDAFAPSQGTNPMAQSRTFAILHASIHDALNAIEPRYQPYTPGLAAAPGASPDAAVAAAAREVLVRLLPDRSALVEDTYARVLAAVPEGPAKTAGIATGQAAANSTIARRQTDGADRAAQPPYAPRSGPGEYQFTPPFDFAAQPGWGYVQPFVIELRDHALEGPLPLTSPQYAQDFAHVQRIGQLHSKQRTHEQTEIAKFWYEDSPLGWNRIANAVVRQRSIDNWDAARAFALVHFAMADGFIAGFVEKYEHRFWRPMTAIHAAATDGNPHTHADSTWQPLLPTPPVPDYPSTHTVLGWAAAEALIHLFGDQQRYELTSLTLPGVTRRYRSFSDAAEENGLSRLYAGIHFPYAVKEGKRQGRSIGQAAARALPAIH